MLKVMSEEVEDVCTCHALALMKREGGVLLALPAGALPIETLTAAAEGDPFTMYGPHTIVTMKLGALEELAELDEVEVLIVDVDGAVKAHLSPLPDPVPDNFVSFGPDPSLLPNLNGIMQAAREWIAATQEDQPLAYFSAVEEAMENGPTDPPVPKAPTSKAAPKAKAKRMTTAALAEQMGQISDVLPQLSRQINALQKGQEELRSQMLQSSQAVPPRASQVAVSAPLKSFAKMVGSPPRVRQGGISTLKPLEEDQPEAAGMAEMEEEPMMAGGMLAQAVLEQSKALTNLVSQLSSGGDPLLDGQAGPSTISLGSRGAQGREKLQLELANRSGGFFLSVLQNAFKRLKPATKIPTSIAAAQQVDFSMVTYLEKFGGYGQSREMGLVQYCLAHIFDNALQEDLEGVREHLALLMTAVEQAVQDGNKWELAYQLTLLEEPPSQLWAYRQSVTQARLRAFAPLCAQRWATVALAYAKEVDYIQNRKAEMTKKPSPSQPSQETQATPKAKPKRKPKWQGGQGESSGSKKEGEE
eukprot:s614_g21.t1